MGSIDAIRHFIPNKGEEKGGIILTTKLPGFGVYISLVLDKRECEEIARQAGLKIVDEGEVDAPSYKTTVTTSKSREVVEIHRQHLREGYDERTHFRTKDVQSIPCI